MDSNNLILQHTNTKYKIDKENILVARILIVEDELRLSHYLQKLFTGLEYSVFTATTILELKNIFELRGAKFDIVILDRLLHGLDSANIIEHLKQIMPEIKIVVLSAINTPAEKANVLNLGADDYLAKPFESEELIARVNALLRRPKSSFKFGNVTLNSENRSVEVEGTEVELQNKEFLLLRTLLVVPGRIYNKSYLYVQVWNMSADVDSNVIEATVTKLRKRLSDLGANFTVKNSRNIGYWIEE